ncbi:hypothetical protein BST42_08535 [Mycolicibacterium rhodesiae]|uniref:Uncharacterized protein n=2 Tax=Mycolicibacterium rhodesiae TaxID=36814 RepID=A0A1X0J0S5_MYCRH|nr:hypothetical protein BST42_08535 [Mycolicibacterium rhodesiae]
MVESGQGLYPSAMSALALSHWSQAFFVSGLAVGFLAVASAALPISIKRKRWTFWTCWIAAAILLALSGVGRGIAEAGIAALVAVVGGGLFAFYFTPFIKIGGRVRTFWISDAREDPDTPPSPPDSYLERVTAPSMWWNLALVGVITGGFALSMGWLAPVGIMGGALLAAPLALIGYLDRKDRYPVARGRYVPFAIVVLSSIPTLLWPTLVYFVAYYMTTPTPREELTHEPFRRP